MDSDLKATAREETLSLLLKEGESSATRLASFVGISVQAMLQLQEFSCSLRGIAEKFLIVGDQELELIRKTFPYCDVKRVQWRIEFGHACGFQISQVHQ
tara:strand:+ start:102 stop:398 length:297 start_codon:yes stop_codon:yes gene_type:complete